MNKWRNPGGWLCAVALSFACQLSGCANDSGSEPPLVSQRLELAIKASKQVNPDAQNQPAPIEIRVYELKNDSTFTAADWWSLQDNDKAVLADDLLHRDSFILRPGEEKKLRRPLNKQTTALGILAGYRSLGKSVWRAIYPIPEAAEPGWLSRMMPGKKIRLDVGIEQNAIAITERENN